MTYAAVSKSSGKVLFTSKNREILEERAKKPGISYLIIEESQFRHYDMAEVASNRNSWATR